MEYFKGSGQTGVTALYFIFQLSLKPLLSADVGSVGRFMYL